MEELTVEEWPGPEESRQKDSENLRRRHPAVDDNQGISKVNKPKCTQNKCKYDYRNHGEDTKP